MTDRITPDEARVNELVNDALFAYADLAALDPKHWDDSRQIEELNKSREQDPSGLTTFMMLRGLVDHFIREETFTAYDVMYKRKKFDRRVTQIRRVLDMVERPEVVGLIEEFQAELRRMADYYGVPEGKARKEFEKWIQDKYALAYVRRNALRSMETLQPFQFTQGEPDRQDLKIHRSVYEWWNVNSLVAGLATQPVPGVSLNLIRDPEQLCASYFLLAVRNGETITVLTDREEGPHPDFYRMSRRPGRTLEARMERHHFPYQLLEAEPIYSRSGSVINYVEKERTWMKGKLVAYNTAAIKLASIGELDADQIIWLGLVLQLIADRYGRRNLLLPELAYTGEMVAEPEALIGPEAGIVRRGLYQPLQVAPLTREDVTREKTAHQWEREATGFHEWMIERYGEQVPESALNPVGDAQRKLLTEASADELGLTKRREDFWYKHSDEKKREEIEEQHGLKTLSPVTFGTKDKLERDRQWVARVNQAKLVQYHANEEYERTRDETYEWCRERLKVRRERILEAAARGEWWMSVREFEHEIHSAGKLRPARKQQVIRQFVGKSWSWYDGRTELVLGGWKERPFRYTCAVYPETTATIFTKITPPTPEAIAELFGVKVEELPVGLQHWYLHEPYDGNSILDRLDPSDWVLRNPWCEEYSGADGAPFRPQVYVTLSRTAANEIRKRLGLPLKNWKELEKKDE
jgi:hypothetical protein